MRLTQLSRLTSNLARPSGPTLSVDTPPLQGFERLYVRKADGSGFEPFQVLKPDDSGWDDFQVRTNG